MLIVRKSYFHDMNIKFLILLFRCEDLEMSSFELILLVAFVVNESKYLLITSELNLSLFYTSREG